MSPVYAVHVADFAFRTEGEVEVEVRFDLDAEAENT